MRQRLGRKEGEGLELGLDGLRRLAADGDREAARLLAAEAIRRDSLELLIEAEQSMLEPAQDWPGFSEWGVSPQGFRELWHVRTGMMFLELPGPEPSTPVLHEAQPSQQSGSEASANAALREGAELRRLGRVRLTKQNRWLKADFLPQRSLVARERVPERVLDRFLTETKWLPVEDLWSQEDGGVDDYVGSELMGYKLPAFLLWSGLQLPHLWQLEQVYAGSGASDRLGRRAVAEYRTRKRHAMHYGDWRLLSLSALAWDTQEECGLRALNTLAQEVGSVDAQSFVHTAYGTVEYHVEDFRQNPVRELAPARLRLACFADGQEQLGPVNGESAQSDWRALRALLAPPRAPSRPQLCEQVALRLRYEYEQLQQSWARREQERQAEEARSLAAAALEVRRNAFRRQRVRSQEQTAPAPVGALLRWQREYVSEDAAEQRSAEALARLSPELSVYGNERICLKLGENRVCLPGELWAALRKDLDALEPLRLLRAMPRDDEGRLEAGVKVLLAMYPHPDGHGSSTLEARSAEDGLLSLRLERRAERESRSLPLGDYTLRFEGERVYWDRDEDLDPEALWGFDPADLNPASTEHRADYFAPGRRFRRLALKATVSSPWKALRCLSKLDDSSFVEAFCTFPVDLMPPLGLVAAIEVEGESGQRRAWLEGLQAVLRQCTPWRWHTSGHLHRPLLGNPNVLTLHCVAGHRPKLSLQRYSPAHLLPLNWWKQPPELLMARYSDIDFASY